VDCVVSVRTTNLCKENGIDTLGDLCKLHKTDWMKFRHGGKKAFIELDDLLHDNGLDWAQ
jgi:DNA-directed RNA polymerase alpha subunit